MSPDLSTVAVIIVNWNGRRLLETCLPAVLAQTYPSFSVIVVDNGSSDDSVPWLQATFPQVRLIRNDHNAGFSAANNQAFAASSAPFLALLNNDAAPTPTWLSEMMAAATADPCAGMIAAKILNWDRHDRIDSLGLAVDRSGTAWQWRYGEADNPNASKEPYAVFGPSGAACLYRRTMLQDIGGFDESFFAYLEDVDLAWRARLAGWRCLLVPSAIVYHRHSATSGQNSPFKSFHLSRNKWWSIIKNYPTPTLWWNLPLILARDLLALVYHLAIRRDLSALRGRLAAFSSLLLMLRRRRIVQQRATAEGKREAWRLRRPLRF